MLEGAGLDSSLANGSVLEGTDTAQGGPLDLFDESKIPLEFLAIADKLLALNNLENLLGNYHKHFLLPITTFQVVMVYERIQ